MQLDTNNKRSDGPVGLGGPVGALDPQTRWREQEAPPPIRCRACQAVIADGASIFSAPGLFVNPHGFLHEVLLVHAAAGLLLVGEETLEHTWFAGYAWRIALCARCHVHLGWRYTATAPALSPQQFCGLRRSAIVIGAP